MTTEKPLGFGYQIAAGAIAGVSEVRCRADSLLRERCDRSDLWLTYNKYRFS
jgi:hypothetical protein